MGDGVFVKDQATASQNGIYVVAAGAWKRADDANTSALMEPGMVVRVYEGNDNGGLNVNFGGTEWILTTTGPITLETTDLVFAQTDLLRSDKFGQFLGFQGNARADGDIFAITNSLPDGLSDNPQAYLAASLAGYGGICTGVHGRNGNGSVVTPPNGAGLWGESDDGYGVYASSQNADGLNAVSSSPTHTGVFGANLSGGRGVAGISNSAAGVDGHSTSGPGVSGSSDNADGVKGTSASPWHAGVSAINTSEASGRVSSGFGLWASSNNTGVFAQGTPAGYFQGDVLVTGDMVLVNPGGDVAEDFDVEAESLNTEPGMVLIIHENGNLCAASAPYDTRVAGVVAGAGTLKPAVVLQRIPSQKQRSPIALVGKVFCKVDATFGGIVAGDLLTTSTTPGHAMKASDRSRALGAIIGKALAGLDTGLGLIPILVSPR